MPHYAYVNTNCQIFWLQEYQLRDTEHAPNRKREKKFLLRLKLQILFGRDYAH